MSVFAVARRRDVGRRGFLVNESNGIHAEPFGEFSALLSPVLGRIAFLQSRMQQRSSEALSLSRRLHSDQRQVPVLLCGVLPGHLLKQSEDITAELADQINASSRATIQLRRVAAQRLGAARIEFGR